MTAHRSFFTDVAAFHEKFGFATARPGVAPSPLSADMVRYRGKFMLEELAEWFDSQGAARVGVMVRNVMNLMDALEFADAPAAGMADGLDALVDLCYVAMGTAHFGGLPFEEGWGEVQRANLTKQVGTTKRGHSLDVCKPEGWCGPEHWPLIYERAVSAGGYAAIAVSPEQGGETGSEPAHATRCFCISEDTGHWRGSPGCLHNDNPPNCNCGSLHDIPPVHKYGVKGCRYAKD